MRPIVDYTSKVPAEILHSILDYLAQPDVLRTAAVSKWWRAAAVGHPSFYRFIRFHTSEKEFSYPWGFAVFRTALNEVQLDNVRVALDFQVERSSRQERTAYEDVYLTIKTEVVELIAAIFSRVKIFRLAIRDDKRAVAFNMLRQPAPSLESFVLALTETNYSYDESDDRYFEYEDENSQYSKSISSIALPSDIFCSNAPRLRQVDLRGVRLSNNSIGAFSSTDRVRLACETPLRALSISTLFPRAKNVTLCLGYDVLPEFFRLANETAGYSSRFLTIPKMLHSLTFELVGGVEHLVLDLLGAMNISQIPLLAVDLSDSEAKFDWTATLRDLSGPYSLDIGFNSTFGDAWELVPGDMIAIIRPDNSDLERRYYSLVYDPGDVKYQYDDHWNQDAFDMFESLKPICHNITYVYLVHEYLPAFFRISPQFDGLKKLEIDLDMFRGPFWYSNGTDHESPDCSADDVFEPGYRPPSPSYLRRYGGVHVRRNADCPALHTVVLRSSYGDVQISSRQLGHFGYALGLLKRPKPQQPLLVLRGVTFQKSYFQDLHTFVFRDVAVDPLIAKKPRPIDPSIP